MLSQSVRRFRPMAGQEQVGDVYVLRAADDGSVASEGAAVLDQAAEPVDAVEGVDGRARSR
ncbi:hypothetical protein [Streptomyces sp. CRN 30]|uniref:hypothetical protein n=1 Tax=Streptomyces sp. CRN 30 TaxID=3075613 RepID=UPI002A807FF9|nr:hypothetical protein [Streptomyces sp. CRN 30]